MMDAKRREIAKLLLDRWLEDVSTERLFAEIAERCEVTYHQVVQVCEEMEVMK